jgi:hypothetical protein
VVESFFLCVSAEVWSEYQATNATETDYNKYDDRPLSWLGGVAGTKAMLASHKMILLLVRLLPQLTRSLRQLHAFRQPS